MSEKRDNSGAVFVNDRKESENHPDRTGEAMIGGVEYYVSGWLKESKSGKKYMSLAFKPKSETGKKGVQQAKAAAKPEFDDDVPW